METQKCLYLRTQINVLNLRFRLHNLLKAQIIEGGVDCFKKSVFI